MAKTSADPTDEMKEWLELYLHETRGSIITNLCAAWRRYQYGGAGLLYDAENAGLLLARAKYVLERFGESWEGWVASAHAARVVPFEVEQAARLIALHDLGNRIRFDGTPAAKFDAFNRRSAVTAEFIAVLTPQRIAGNDSSACVNTDDDKKQAVGST